MGFTDRDWGDTRRHAPWHRPQPDRLIWSGSQRLVDVAVSDPAKLNRARELLWTQLFRFVTDRGYRVLDSTWSVDAPATDSTTVHLEAELAERTDGEWPAIRRAIEEDEEDRAAAELAAATVDDHLTALANAVDLWANRSLRGF